jgi:hypothetical protein
MIPLVSFANDDKKHEKSKTIKKEFKVNSDALVRLNNRYGNLNITTWNKNRVEIEVKITVKGNDLEDVENKLATIDVSFNASTSLVEAETIFDNNRKGNWSWWKKNKNTNYQINYIVKMPVSNDADLDNDYGDIYLDKLDGRADINCDYGKISIGELTHNDNRINLDYCSRSTISYVKGADVNIDYSKIAIEKSDKILLNADYSTVNFTELTDLNFNTDYGSITVDDATNVSGNGDYTSMRFGTIRKSLKLDSDYGSIRVKNLAKDFDSVDIKSQYAGIRIGTDSNNNFSFVLDLQYAGFKRNDDNIELFKSVVKSTKKHYEGVFGKGNSSSKIKIRSQYGSVSFQENY